MNILKRQHFASNMLSFFLILLSIMIFSSKSNAQMLLTYFLGSFVALVGLLKVVIFIVNGAIYRKNDDLIEGIIFLSFGLTLLLNRTISYQNIGILLGLFLIIKSTFILSEAIDYKKVNLKNWWIDLIFLSFILFYSILLIFYTHNLNQDAFLNIVALALISDGLCTIILSTITFNKTKHREFGTELLENITIYLNNENMINK